MFLPRRNDNGEDGMYANYPNLIFTRMYTNRNITSRISCQPKEKKNRREIRFILLLKERENNIEITV